MGMLVPRPYPMPEPPCWQRDENGYLHYLRPRWPWLCPYCHTVQRSDRHACTNCGAARPEPTPEEQP